MEIVNNVLLPIFEFISTLAHALIVTLISMVKACLPIGVLPRKSIKGETCLITGSGSGLGRLMALEFSKHGCNIVLWDVNTSGNEETKKLLRNSGVTIWTYTVDLSDRKDIAAKAALVHKEVGNVDILVNNAGIVTGKMLIDSSDEQMETTMAVNCMAYLYTTKAFIKGMIARNHGHLVSISSIAGKHGAVGLVDYCASKHGVIGFHASVAEELRILKADRVKTSLICPYYINTGMFDGVVSNAPTLLPILDSAYVIDCIMEAVLTNKEEYFIPRFLYFTVATSGLFPTRASTLVTKYLKIAETMKEWARK